MKNVPHIAPVAYAVKRYPERVVSPLEFVPPYA